LIKAVSLIVLIIVSLFILVAIVLFIAIIVTVCRRVWVRFLGIKSVMYVRLKVMTEVRRDDMGIVTGNGSPEAVETGKKGKVCLNLC
jgi:hypothetical protein